ncbi:PLP-dependent aminotransferase family protein [Lentilitoribacter sp. EG35]|uniref:aminotransferase-like domain-containing protein n=1 Tax=Lentilitoribacter sp. EG35 TaxID=3234192 RepID=UPI00345F227D
MNIQTHTSTRTLTRAAKVCEIIRSQIASRSLGVGERLPSIRNLAQTLKVSPSTVVDAYDQLVADGVIYARRGAGFYVADLVQPFDITEVSPQVDRAIDPFWVSRQSLGSDRHALKPGCGWLPADWMPNSSIRKAMRKLSRADDKILSNYGQTHGSQNIRRWLSRQFSDEGLSVDPEKILLTPSGTQAIDLICRFLLRAGDTVLVDDPCYFNFQALLRAHQVNIIAVPLTKNGPDLPAFEQALIAHKPRLYLTNSALQNPTGLTLSPKTAHKILSLADAHDLIIVEDDIFASLEPEPSTRMASLDGLERVIRIGSFSKTLSASLRCGYIVARPDWVDGLIDLQIAINFGGSSPVASELIYATLSDGSYRKHLDGLRTRLDKKRHEIADKLSAIGIEPWLMPRGGFYLWCQLPEGVDSAKLARFAMGQNIVLAPGNVFSTSQSMASFMRFNVSQMESSKIFKVLREGISSL